MQEHAGTRRNKEEHGGRRRKDGGRMEQERREHIRVTMIGHISGSGFGVWGFKIEQGNEDANKNGNMK